MSDFLAYQVAHAILQARLREAEATRLASEITRIRKPRDARRRNKWTPKPRPLAGRRASRLRQPA